MVIFSSCPLLNFFFNILSTPVIWIFLIILLFYMFRKEIKNILNSLANKGAITFKGVHITLGTDKVITNQQGVQYDKFYQSPIVTNEENIIRQQLNESGYNAEKQINTLIYQLANKNIQQQLTIINCSIYLEQLSLLKNLNIFNSKPITESQINSDYYSKYLTRIQSYPKSEVSVESNLDSFIWYLLNSQLIVKSNDGYVITQLGRELLIFRIRYGLD